MKIDRSGIILNTEKYEECVFFYTTLFGFEILYQENEDDFQLTCLDFMGAYLMIETGGTALKEGRPIKDCPIKFRINVSDIEQALTEIINFGIKAEIERNTWGSTINLFDPDGNRVGVRDSETFEKQLW